MKKIKTILAAAMFVGVIAFIGINIISQRDFLPTITVSPYPNGLNFAFTITDDPDDTSVEKVRPIYELLDKLHFKTTIACWVLKPTDVSGLPDPQEQIASQTLEDHDYAQFLFTYKRKGFEIALHTVSAGHDTRQNTIDGYDKFRAFFGEDPGINIMHSKNMENIYWGTNIFENKFMKMLVNMYTSTKFSGESDRSVYFWGDICRNRTKYVRLLGTTDINTLKYNPTMPYHDKRKPYVNYWFSFSDGYNVKYFNSLLSGENIARLSQERGTAIVYTHFAAGFTSRKNGGPYKLNDETKTRLTALSSMPQGWFVPASKIPDRLLLVKKFKIRNVMNTIIITNTNKERVSGITLLTRPFMRYYDSSGKMRWANKEGEIVLGNFRPMESKKIILPFKVQILPGVENPGEFEKFKMLFERLMIMLLSHRG